MATLHEYLVVAAILFLFGLFIMITRRHGVWILMGVELILNGANLNLVAFSRYGGSKFAIDGQVFALFVILVAAAEAAVALAIFLSIYYRYVKIDLDEVDTLQG